MPVHDWTRVAAGIFHDFHHGWIEEIKRALNAGILPREYHALAEQFAGGFGPGVPTVQSLGDGHVVGNRPTSAPVGGGLLLAAPKLRLPPRPIWSFTSKQKVVAVRHVSGDRVVAMVGIVSPGNKANHNALQSFVRKASELLSSGVHLLIIDLYPPGRHDPQGIHAAVWDDFARQAYLPPAEKHVTIAAYESALSVRTYVQHVAAGKPLPDMPLFLEPDGQVPVPLEATYDAAWRAVPRCWQTVLEPPLD